MAKADIPTMLARWLVVALAASATLGVAVSPATATPPKHAAAHFLTRPAHPVTLHAGPARSRPSGVAGRAALTTADFSTQSAGTAAIVTGTKRSTWQVTYTGFTAAAKTAFQAAVERWSTIVSSPVPIKVNATFEPMATGLLGYASPQTLVYSPSLGDGFSYYPIGLANAMWGSDIYDTIPDIDAHFSSTASDVYYGTDGNVPFNGLDFVSVVMHELGHGLGFVGAADGSASSGILDPEDSTIYDSFTVDGSGGSLLDYTSPSTALGTVLRSGVYWDGANAKTLNGGVRPKLYSPSIWQSGSSYSHLDESTYVAGTPNALMTPILQRQEVIRTPGPLAVGMLKDEGWGVAVPTVPAAPTTVTGVELDSAVRVSWPAAVDNGADVDHYTVTASPGGATSQVSGSATSATVTGLTNGTPYTFTVTAHNIFGDGPASAPSADITPAPDVLAPTGAIASGPASGAWSSGTPTFTFSATDPGRPGATFTYSCQIDAGTPAGCATSKTFSLATGTHTLTVIAYDEALNASAPVTRTWKVDAIKPSTPTVTASTFSLASTLPFTMKATDTGGSGFYGFSVRWRKAPWNNTWGSTSSPALTTSSTYSISGASKGYTYCVYVRSRDKVGNLSTTEVSRCTATALDDRSLTASSGWTRGTSTSYYAGTYSLARKTGITLTRSSVQARRLAVVATTCSTCGSIDVYWNGVLIKTLSLYSSTTKLKQTLLAKDFGAGVVKSGTLVIKTKSTKSVYVDGLGVSRA